MNVQPDYGGGGIANLMASISAARIGDCTPIANGNRIVTDRVLGEESRRLIGTHGGLSAAEMYVPLVVVDS
jgi:hypothetical protein